jgi:hypothetical protein
MTALRFGKLIVSNDPARLSRVVVLDRRLEVLAQRVGLPKLTTQPAAEADLAGAAYRLETQVVSRRSTTKPSRS